MAALVCLLAFVVTATGQQEKDQLKFHQDKSFKIAQFTDLHWDNGSANCSKTRATIEMVLKTEKPDLAILTGDIVTNIPAKEGWQAVATPFIETKTPWAVTLGNHDAEPGISRDEIFELLETMPYFVGSKGPELTGCGNYVLEIKSSESDQTAAVLYCFDSNSYSTNRKASDYDWVHFDQIGWYRTQSQQFTTQNAGSPLPSLAFLHIPLIEYKFIEDKESTVGRREEGVASADLNSGLFASLFEMKDVMGVFAGHDHDNNYIGIHKEIALAFGQRTGADAYGKLPIGSRIIQLAEGDYRFDSWIRTDEGVSFKFNYPSGLTYDDSNAEYFPAVSVKGVKPGATYRYFEGEFKQTEELKKAKPVASGVASSISLEPAKQDDYFGLEYTAYLKIDKKGVYRFYTYSDDGSRLYIDNQLVVDNDGSHSARRKDGQIALEAGYHELKVLYFESYMGQELEVGISGLSIRETPIPGNMLFYKK